MDGTECRDGSEVTVCTVTKGEGAHRNSLYAKHMNAPVCTWNMCMQQSIRRTCVCGGINDVCTRDLYFTGDYFHVADVMGRFHYELCTWEVGE